MRCGHFDDAAKEYVIETPGESFQTVENNDTGVAESVFIGGMFVLYGGQYADIIEHYGKLTGMDDANVAKEAANIRAEIGQVSEAVKTAGWDGEWFVRAYDAYSRKVDTHEDTEGQIYIEPQGMCVMAGIGLDDGKAQQALKSVKDRLTCDWGTAILAPAYSTYRIELGEISSYPRGYKENGGILCHNNPWISIANALAGNDDETFAVYQRNCPAYVEDKSDIRKVEPYAYCQMVAGPESPTPGEGKNSWLTGTAAWTFVDVSQYLLGRPPDARRSGHRTASAGRVHQSDGDPRVPRCDLHHRDEAHRRALRRGERREDRRRHRPGPDRHHQANQRHRHLLTD